MKYKLVTSNLRGRHGGTVGWAWTPQPSWVLTHAPGDTGSQPTTENHTAQLLCRRRQWHPSPVLVPGKPHGWRSLVSCSPWDRQELDTTERLHFHFSHSCIGEGNGTPLQCSCLENSRDGGAWWAAVYGVAQSRTRLKRLNSSSSSSCSVCKQTICPTNPTSRLPVQMLSSVCEALRIFIPATGPHNTQCDHLGRIYLLCKHEAINHWMRGYIHKFCIWHGT